MIGEEVCGEGKCGWGCDCGATQDVLRAVLEVIIRIEGAVGAGKALATFAAVCRSWNFAASAPGLWRQALEDGSPSAKQAGVRFGPKWWRDEYILAHAGWRFIKHLAPDEEDVIQEDPSEAILNNTEETSIRKPINENDRQLDNDENRQPNGDFIEELQEHAISDYIEPENGADFNNNRLKNRLSVISIGQDTPEPPFGRGVSISHAALSFDGKLLAVAADDATIAVWERIEKVEERWSEIWRVTESRWSSAWSVQWCPDGSQKLLVTGAVRGTARGEAAVREVGGTVKARAGVAPPEAVHWCGGNAFLALEPRLVAPGLSFTLVWMYSATQQVDDADAEVAAPVFCLFNEANTHYSHIIVMKMPKKEKNRRSSPNLDMEETSNDNFGDIIDSSDEECERSEIKCCEGLIRPRQYFRALRDIEQASEKIPAETEDFEDEDDCYVIVCAGGTPGKERGICSSLRSWRVLRDKKPEREKIGLKERREARERAREHPVEEPEFDEAAIRERCRLPDGKIALQGSVRGLMGTAGVVWAVTPEGAVCIRVREGAPAMTLLAQFSPQPHTAPPYAYTTPYYIYPVVNDQILVSPCVCGCGGVLSWCVRSLRVCASPPPPRAPRPPIAALLLPATQGEHLRMLVLLGSHIHIWESRVPQNQQED